VSIEIENMTPPQRRKNLLSEEKGNTPQEKTVSSTTVEDFLDQAGFEWEKKGRGIYVYPSSLEGVKKLVEKVPMPDPDEYIIVPLGSVTGYNVFILISRNGISVRIGYGRGNIPYSPSLLNIVEKVAKVSKEIGIESAKGGKNLLGD